MRSSHNCSVTAHQRRAPSQSASARPQSTCEQPQPDDKPSRLVNGSQIKTVSDGTRTVTYHYLGDDLQTVTDVMQRVTTYEYNNHLLTAIHDHNGQVVEAMLYDQYAPQGRVIHKYTYDAANNVTSVTCGITTTSSLRLTEVYTYTAGNLLSESRSADGVATYYTYNDRQQISVMTTTYAYDALNRVTSYLAGAQMRSNHYNGDGVLVAQTSDSTTTRYTHDLATPLSRLLGDDTSTYVYGQAQRSVVLLQTQLNRNRHRCPAPGPVGVQCCPWRHS